MGQVTQLLSAIGQGERDALLRQRVIDECLVPYLHDRQDTWLLLPDGSYERVGEDLPSAQQALMRRYTVSGQGRPSRWT